MSIYVRAIGEVKKISKLLNAFGGEDKRSRIEQRDLREKEKEYKIFRTGRSRDEKEEKVAREDDERTRREKLIYVPCTYCRCAYLQTRALSRLAILESEKDDYLHRDTSSLNRLVYLLIYLSVVLCVPYSSIDVSLAFLFFYSFFFFLSSFLSYSRENVFARALRKTVNNRESLNLKCSRDRDYDMDGDKI